MNKQTYIVTIFLIFIGIFSFAQMKEYTYKRKIKGVEKQWHHMQLPNAIFNEVNTNMADIRIYGITATDTIEAPYVLKQLKAENKTIKMPFETQNKVYNENGYFYTFIAKKAQEINQLHLNFEKDNFDWKIKLEGSNDGKQWFTIVDDYRVVAINNENVAYQFTNIVFPKSKYSTYRLVVKTDEDPQLSTATFNLKTKKEGKLRQYIISSQSVKNDKKAKQTIVSIDLEEKVAINSLHLDIKNTTDYYRHYTLSYLSSRFKTEKGWIENYTTITSGVLSSLSANTIVFNTVIAKKIKIVIHNQDNAPLKISSNICSGYVYQLTARFDEKAKYFLVNGRKNDNPPKYDIVRFGSKIPTTATMLKLGEVSKIKNKEVEKSQPLFINKMWLWAVMFVIIGLLGWFSVKMMRDK